MNRTRTLIVAALAAAFSGAAAAQTVKPIADQVVKFSATAGDVYYTIRPDGYHVVATFAGAGEGAAPIRFETVLSPNQTVTISTPRAQGIPAEAVEISRHNDQIQIRQPALVD